MWGRALENQETNLIASTPGLDLVPKKSHPRGQSSSRSVGTDVLGMSGTCSGGYVETPCLGNLNPSPRGKGKTIHLGKKKNPVFGRMG